MRHFRNAIFRIPDVHTYRQRSRPGANLRFALQGTDNYATPLHARLALSRAQIVIENFGINDAYLPAEEYRSNLRQFVDTVRASGKLPVLEEPNPDCVYPGDALYAFKAAREAEVLVQVIRTLR